MSDIVLQVSNMTALDKGLKISMTNDLERVLGYQDAIDTSTGIAKVGDELLSLSCWTADF
ncbi:MAG: hypothetical protein JHC58_07040, partial [Ilumatobacteraceae bacterium]|nr:hypothetical protein [Ilumatobacteraceae bacterium]